jgi:hypothetical protein
MNIFVGEPLSAAAVRAANFCYPTVPLRSDAPRADSQQGDTIAMASMIALWQNNTNPLSGLFGTGFLMFALVLAVIAILGWWKMFEKANEPGWAAIVPIYNVYILLKIAGRPGWWLILYCIPLINLIPAIVVAIDVAKAFGQSPMFGFFLNFLFGGIGYLILGFGNYQYRRPAAMAATA